MSAPNDRELEIAATWVDGWRHRKCCAESIAAYRAEIEAKHAAEVREMEQRLNRAQSQLFTGDRVCDSPSCLAAVIRRDDGERVCAEGHAPRFVVIDSQADVLARAEKAEAELAEARATLNGAMADWTLSDAVQLKRIILSKRSVFTAHIALACLREAFPRGKPTGGERAAELTEARETIHLIADALGLVSWTDCGRYDQASDESVVAAAKEAITNVGRLGEVERELAEARATNERLQAEQKKVEAL